MQIHNVEHYISEMKWHAKLNSHRDEIVGKLAEHASSKISTMELVEHLETVEGERVFPSFWLFHAPGSYDDHRCGDRRLFNCVSLFNLSLVPLHAAYAVAAPRRVGAGPEQDPESLRPPPRQLHGVGQARRPNKTQRSMTCEQLERDERVDAPSRRVRAARGRQAGVVPEEAARGSSPIAARRAACSEWRASEKIERRCARGVPTRCQI